MAKATHSCTKWPEPVGHRAKCAGAQDVPRVSLPLPFAFADRVYFADTATADAVPRPAVHFNTAGGGLFELFPRPPPPSI